MSTSSTFLAPAGLTEVYESNALFAKLVDMPAEDAAYTGFILDGISRKAADFYRRELDRLSWEVMASDALSWQRLFSGSIVVVLVDDGGGISDPLQFAHVKRVCGLQVFPSWAVTPNIDPNGEPESFTVRTSYADFTAHAGRCLVFRSDRLPERAEDDGPAAFWGATMYYRIQQALQTVETSGRAPARILSRLQQTVLKIHGLSELLSTAEGEAQLADRLLLMDSMRGLLSTVALDAEDDYIVADTKIPLTEAAAVINSCWSDLSAASGIPVSVIVGGPLPDSGEKIRAPLQRSSDPDALKMYSAYVREIQVQQIKPPLRRLLEIIGRAGLASGELDKLEQAQIDFPPLYPPRPARRS